MDLVQIENGVSGVAIENTLNQIIDAFPGVTYSVARQHRFVSALLSGASTREAAKEFLQIVSTNNEMNRVIGSATTSGNVKQVCRKRKFIGQTAVNVLFLTVDSYYVPSPTTVETNGPSYVCRAHVEFNGIAVVATWDAGASSKTVAAGDADIQSDGIYPAQFGLTEFPAGEEYYEVIEREFAVGVTPAYWGLSAYTPANPEEITLRAASGTASKIGTPGALTSGAGWTSTAAHFGAVTVGIPVTQAPSVGILGASIEDGTNDANGDGATGTGGYIRRGLMSGDKIAFLSLAKGSDAAYNFVAGFAKRRKYFKYISDVINGYGGNDFTDNRTSANLIADLSTIAASLRQAGAQRIYQIKMFPKSDSTDAWATLTNQTVRSNSSANFVAYRAAVEAGLAGNPNISGVIDLTGAVEDVTTPGKWQYPGFTIDGTHPEADIHGLLATPFRAAIDDLILQLS